MKVSDVSIIGGGIAGLSCACYLARGGLRVALFEQEALLGAHASGRNAAIFRSADSTPFGVALAESNRASLDALCFDAQIPWLQHTETFFVSHDPSLLIAEQGRLVAAGFAAKRLSFLAERELLGAVPLLAGGLARAALRVDGDGVMDIHGVLTHLAEQARRAGAVISVGAKVAQIKHDGKRVHAVRLADGQTHFCDAVVIAAGAWSAALGSAAGAPLPLVPMRRHLFQLELDFSMARRSPIVWSLDREEECYFRPESGGVLCSPCDEDPHPAQEPRESEEAAELLAQKLARLAPRLAEQRVKRRWACLRTFAPDRVPVAGPDPRLRGLYWLAGLGGHGMSFGFAAAPAATGALLRRDYNFGGALSPARLLG